MLESDLDSTRNTDWNADKKNHNNGDAYSEEIVIKECPDGESKQVELDLHEDIESLSVSGNRENVNATFKDENGQAMLKQASENNEGLDVLQMEDLIEKDTEETRNENQLREATQILETSSNISTIASDDLPKADTNENFVYGSSENLQGEFQSPKLYDMAVVEVTHASMLERPIERSVENVLSESPVELMQSSDHLNVHCLTGNNGELYFPMDCATSVERSLDISDDAVHQLSSVRDDEISTVIENLTIGESNKNITSGQNHAEWELHDSSFKQDWSNQDACMTAIVSADLDGWQRFDVEDNTAAIPCVADGTRREQQQLWEQLLEDGLDSTQNKIDSVTLPTAHIKFDGSHSWLASPGNPFIESNDRISNFSEADGFAVPGSGFTYVHQESSLYFEEDPFRDANANKDFMPTVDLRSNKSDATLNMKEPSFGVKFLDSESPTALTSMPVHQRVGYDPAHETWEANFDTPVPFGVQNNFDPNGTEEISRSSSMPRMADHGNEAQESHQQEPEHRWSFSAASRELATSATPNKRKPLPHFASELKSAVVVSPRISPLVKKVVKKIQTSPVVNKTVLKNAIPSPNNVATVAEKPKKKSIWAHFICCSKMN